MEGTMSMMTAYLNKAQDRKKPPYLSRKIVAMLDILNIKFYHVFLQ